MSRFDELPYEIYVLIVEYLSVDAIKEYTELCLVNTTFYDVLRGHKMHLLRPTWENVLTRPMKLTYKVQNDISNFEEWKRVKSAVDLEINLFHLWLVYDEGIEEFLPITDIGRLFIAVSPFLLFFFPYLFYTLLKYSFYPLSWFDLLPFKFLLYYASTIRFLKALSLGFYFFNSKSLKRRDKGILDQDFIKEIFVAVGNWLLIFSVFFMWIFPHVIQSDTPFVGLPLRIILPLSLTIVVIWYFLELYLDNSIHFGPDFTWGIVVLLALAFLVLSSLLFVLGCLIDLKWLFDEETSNPNVLLGFRIFFSFSFSVIWCVGSYLMDRNYIETPYFDDHFRIEETLSTRPLWNRIWIIYRVIIPCTTFSLLVFRTHPFFILLPIIMTVVLGTIKFFVHFWTTYKFSDELESLLFLIRCRDYVKMRYRKWSFRYFIFSVLETRSERNSREVKRDSIKDELRNLKKEKLYRQFNRYY